MCCGLAVCWFGFLVLVVLLLLVGFVFWVFRWLVFGLFCCAAPCMFLVDLLMVVLV